MKATAKAPTNIAFIKYWGKADSKTRIPLNSSISMNLSDIYTITTVSFEENLKRGDHVEFVNETVVTEEEYVRMVGVLDRIRNSAQIKKWARVRTQNNFPKACGIASSASGFAALSLAALTATGIELDERELSIFARLASGASCRSIPDGFVKWEKGTGPDDSFAYQLYPPVWWKISDVVVIVTSTMKKVSSTEGHRLALTSPFYAERLKGMDEKIEKIKNTIKERNFSEFGKIVEDEALNMHAICMTSTPPLLYWEPTTIAIMKKVTEWRENGDIESYFTIDAGPSVHVICQKKDAEDLADMLKSISGVERVIINNPSRGAHLIQEHLF